MCCVTGGGKTKVIKWDLGTDGMAYTWMVGSHLAGVN
jgi:hypothetical protein